MPRRIARPALLTVACAGVAFAAIAPDASGVQVPRHDLVSAPMVSSTESAPGIDPGYINSELACLVTHFQHREAGYRADSAGHTGFTRYWAAQMQHQLAPFGARVQTYRFPIRGWLGHAGQLRQQ